MLIHPEKPPPRRKTNLIYRLHGWILRLEVRLDACEKKLEIDNAWKRNATGLPPPDPGIAEVDQIHALIAQLVMRVDELERAKLIVTP